MKKGKARIFFIVALSLMALVVYHFFIDYTGKQGPHDRFRLNAGDDVVAVELIGPGAKRLMFEKHDNGEWFSNDSVRIDAWAVNDLLNALQRMQIRRPVSIAQRQQVIDDLMTHGVRVKVHAGRHWVNLPGNVRIIYRKKQIYDVLLGYDPEVFQTTIINTPSGDIPYETYLPSRDKSIESVFQLDLGFWKDPTVVNLLPSEISNISVRFPANESESFQLALLTDTFFLYDNEGNKIKPALINGNKLARFVNAFSDLSYERLVTIKPGQLPADIIAGNPFLHQKIRDSEGNHTELSYFYRKVPNDGTLVSEYREHDPNRFYLETPHGGFALAQFFVFQPTIRPLSYFMENTE